MATINPWINFNGNAEEAFDFYQSVFGGEVTKAENGMFISLPIGKENRLIANNVPPEMGRVNENENRSKIAVSAESKEEADRIFNGLSAGGAIEVPMSDGMGFYMGMFRDQYGIEWIIESTPNN
jgi:PhnB protein